MKTILILILAIIPFVSLSQIPEFENPCLEDENSQYDSRYYPKRFSKKVSLYIEIKQYKYGSETYTSDFKFEGKIKDETEILPINDSLGIKFSLARSVRNGQNMYLYILALYTKKKDDCWRAMAMYNTYSEVWYQEMQLTGGGVGYPGDKTYFNFVEGLIKLN